MPTLLKQWSADDVLLKQGPLHPERRARLTLPSKQRRPFSHMDISSLYGPAPSHDDLASRISNGLLLPDQIRRLSKLPIAKKLHISSANYALPIPFKLQLPPKLSARLAPSSPEPSRGRPTSSLKPFDNSLPVSPTRSPKRLVFTGSSYEPAESSELELELSFIKPPTPQKPPATMANRRKVARFAVKHQSMPLDQLSMIEEASNAGSSRASSTKLKQLPLLPKTRQSDQLKILTPVEPTTPTSPSQRTRNTLRKPPPELELPKPVSVSASKPHLDLIPPPPPPIQLPTSVSAPLLSQRKTEESSADSSFNYPRKLETRVVTESPRRHPDANLSHGDINVFPTTPEPLGEGEKQLFQKSVEPAALEQTPASLPHSHACHHNLNLGEDSYLKIYKRSFSDESKVSSVSSFSSVGDALNMGPEPMRVFNRSQNAPSTSITNYHHVPIRGASFASSKSDSSQSSWDSIQKSVDFSLRDSASASERLSLSSKSVSSRSTRKTSKELPSPPEELELEGDSLDDKFEVPRELEISKKASDASTVPVKQDEKNLAIQKNTLASELSETDNDENEETERSSNSLDDGNSGVGRGFSFPNDMSNITNSDEARKRLLQQRLMNRNTLRNRSTRRSQQIEIPNVDDLDSILSYRTLESRHNGVSFNDLQKLKSGGLEKDDTSDIEPLGVPSLAAKKHFTDMYGHTSSSESDASFEKTNFKPSKPLCSPPKLMPTSTSLGAIASRKSPIRHARHRLMYNFDFADLYNEPSPKNSISNGKQSSKHKVSKSISAPLEVPMTPPSPVEEEDTKEAQKPVTATQGVEDEQPLNIIVAEPPKRIQYAVDFRDASSSRKPDSAPFGNNFGAEYYHQSGRSSHSRNSIGPSSVNSHQISGSSQSKFSDSLVTARETISTAPTDTDSITIDLTKEDYNVCMIKRNDSTLSYRSVIEKRNGRPVEIVLVDEEEENGATKILPREERDDLLSIYSRYMSDWDRQRKPVKRASLKLSVSEASERSWSNSETGFQVKTQARDPAKQLRKATMPNLEQFRNNDTLANPTSKRVQLTPKLNSRNAPIANGSYRENNHFDYNGTEKYDFESFMQQRL